MRATGGLRLESLEPRLVLDGSGFAGNECPPDLDLSGVEAQQVTVGQTLTLDLLAAGGTVVDLDAEGEPTGDVIRLVLDPDVPEETPTGASITPEGVFSWTPTASQVGTFTIVVIAIDEGTPPLADAETFTIEVMMGNQAPSVDLNGEQAGTGFAASFTEGDDPVPAVDEAGLVVTDADDTMLESATATISNLADGESEVLTVDTTGTAITAEYDEATGVLSLTGSDTLAAYQQVLRTLSYENTSEDPTTGDRTIEVTVSDSDDTSAVATSTITVAATNDPPEVDLNGEEAGADFEATFTEGDGAVAIVGDELTVADADDTMLSFATVEITGVLDGADELLEVDTSGTAITANFSSGVLMLTGSDTVAAYQQVLRTLTYNNTSANPSTASRSVSITVNDGTNGSVARTATVNIVLSNNPPDLAEIGDRTGSVGEELVIPFSASDIDTGDTLTFELDVDNSPPGAELFYTPGETEGEIRWTPTIDDLGETVAFVLLATDDGTPARVDSQSFSVTVGAPRPVVDLNGDGEGIDFTAGFLEDDGPVSIADEDLSITSPTSSTITAASVTIDNIEDGDDEVLAVDTTGTSIAADYTGGVLTLAGEDSIENYETVLSSLTYNNSSQDPTDGFRLVRVLIDDGAAISLAATATVTIEAVNDDPDLTVPAAFEGGGIVSIEQGLTASFSVGVDDADHGPGELFYTIDSDDSGLPEQAVLPTISASDASPPGEFNWVPDTVGTFAFRIIVTDADGGVDQQLVTYTVTEPAPPGVVAAPTGILSTSPSTLEIEFNEAIRAESFDVGNFSLQILGGANDGQPIDITSVESNGSLRTIATLSFAEPLADENYRLTLNDTAIVDDLDQALAGDTTFDFTVDTMAAAFAAFGEGS